MPAPRLASRSPGRILAIALIGALTTGCYTTTMVSPLALPGLAESASPFAKEPRAVQDLDGKVVMISERFSVKLDPRPDLPSEWARWGETTPAIESPFAAAIRGPMLMIQGQKDPTVTQVPLAYVQRVQVREYSPGKTAGLAVGLSLGGLTVIAAVAFGIIATSIGNIR